MIPSQMAVHELLRHGGRIVMCALHAVDGVNILRGMRYMSPH